eukprot:scaffold85323_cov19-Tisochrysis_lutea.AAC.1
MAEGTEEAGRPVPGLSPDVAAAAARDAAHGYIRRTSLGAQRTESGALRASRRTGKPCSRESKENLSGKPPLPPYTSGGRGEGWLERR